MNKMAVSTGAERGGAGYNGSPLFTETLEALVQNPADMPADETFLNLLEAGWADLPDGTLQEVGFARQRHATLLKLLGAEAVTPAYTGTVLAATTFADRDFMLRDAGPATVRAVAGILLYFTTTISPGSLSAKMGVAASLPSVHRADAVKRVSRDPVWKELQPLLREVVSLGHVAAGEWLASEQGARLRALTTQEPAARRSRRPRLTSWRPPEPKAHEPYVETDFDLPGHLQLLEGRVLRPTNRRAYALEIAKIPKLEPGEVINLVKRMERGARAAEQLGSPKAQELLRDKRRELQLLRKEGEQAELYLNVANLRLVTAMASYYSRLLPNMSPEDLISAGNLGLVNAVKGFDYTLGNTFSTHAVWEIRKYMLQTIKEVVPPVKIPAVVAERIRSYREIRDELTQRLGRLPTVRDIAHEMNLALADVEEFLGLMIPPRSLSQVDERGRSWVADEIDAAAPSLEEQVIEADARARTQANIDRLFQRVFKGMGERNEKIVRAACGLGQPKQTYAQVAQNYGLTKGRVDQIVTSFRRRVTELAGRRRRAA